MEAYRLICSALALMVTAALPAQTVNAQETENLQGLATASCDMPGLTVAPPEPWYSVPIESQDPVIAGCQMIWEDGDQYMGIMRLVSFDLRERPDDAQQWVNLALAFEEQVFKQMNFTLMQPLWKRETLPVSGEGFANGSAVGFEIELAGVAHRSEGHFVFFEGATHRYVISLITPSEEASPDIYQANTKAMSTVMQTLQPRK
jgi:hypothetical protein